jgi:hypothetical protein
VCCVQYGCGAAIDFEIQVASLHRCDTRACSMSRLALSGDNIGSAAQMGLMVEGALRETAPGSVAHVAAAARLFDAAHAASDAPAELHAAAAQLASLAVTTRYGDVGAMFPRAVAAYLDADGAAP